MNLYCLPRYAINDISLMNLSNHLTDLLVYLSLPFLCFNQVFLVPISVSNIQRFNLFYSANKLRLTSSPFCWDCKGKNLFVIVKKNKIFFFFSDQVNKTTQTNNNSNLKPSINILLHLFLSLSLPPKRDAKVGKNLSPTNYNYLLFTINT